MNRGSPGAKLSGKFSVPQPLTLAQDASPKITFEIGDEEIIIIL